MEASLTLWNDLHSARTTLVSRPSSRWTTLVTTSDPGCKVNALISCSNGNGGGEEKTGGTGFDRRKHIQTLQSQCGDKGRDEKQIIHGWMDGWMEDEEGGG